MTAGSDISPNYFTKSSTFKEKVRDVLNKEEKLRLRGALIDYRGTGQVLVR